MTSQVEMWRRLTQRLTDPVTYRKHWRNLARRIVPPRPPQPVSLDRFATGPTLAIFAHPDDEIFASALICELCQRGVPVHIACLTRGEGGATGGLCTRAGLGPAREAELRASAAALGVASIVFLDHIDPPADTHRVYAPSVSVDHLASQIGVLADEIRAAAILTHGSGGEYWHPAHLLAHAATRRVRKVRLPILTIHAWRDNHALPDMLNRDDPADLIVDARPHRERRLAALRAHRTQAGYFEKLGGGTLEGYIDRVPEEAFRFFPAGQNI